MVDLAGEHQQRGALRPAVVDAADAVLVERDAAMVGGYLDGWPGVEAAFTTAARRAAGLD